MKSFLPLIAGLALAASAVGCVDDDKSFYIEENRASTAGCVAGNESLWGGKLDVAVSGFGYSMNPVVRNGMRASAGNDNQPERNRLHMRRFDVEIQVGAFSKSFSFPASGTIDPGAQEIFSNVPVVQADHAALLAAEAANNGGEVFAEVRLRAVADRSGDEMESAEFLFPIQVCNRCLVELLDTCPGADDEITITTNSCGLPQDSPVTCCTSSTGEDLCFSGS